MPELKQHFALEVQVNNVEQEVSLWGESPIEGLNNLKNAAAAAAATWTGSIWRCQYAFRRSALHIVEQRLKLLPATTKDVHWKVAEVINEINKYVNFLYVRTGGKNFCNSQKHTIRPAHPLHTAIGENMQLSELLFSFLHTVSTSVTFRVQHEERLWGETLQKCAIIAIWTHAMFCPSLWQQAFHPPSVCGHLETVYTLVP